jgi:hypothetical protein
MSGHWVTERFYVTCSKEELERFYDNVIYWFANKPQPEGIGRRWEYSYEGGFVDSLPHRGPTQDPSTDVYYKRGLFEINCNDLVVASLQWFGLDTDYLAAKKIGFPTSSDAYGDSPQKGDILYIDQPPRLYPYFGTVRKDNHVSIIAGASKSDQVVDVRNHEGHNGWIIYDFGAVNPIQDIAEGVWKCDVNGKYYINATASKGMYLHIPGSGSEYEGQTISNTQDPSVAVETLSVYRPRRLIETRKWVEDPEKKSEVNYLDPLLLDLNGKGITTVGLDAGLHFDHDGNGLKELTGWVAQGDGMLMLDKNGNGLLDDGSELFGDWMLLPDGTQAANGFQALIYYDANSDGKIDAQDPIWSQLRIWQANPRYVFSSEDFSGSVSAAQIDALNELTKTDPDADGQISSLDEQGIAAIHLDSEILNNTDSAGNTEVRAGHFEFADGTTGTIADYSLQRDLGDTKEAAEVEVPSDMAVLPDLTGSGNVLGLQQAMARDSSGELKALVEQFAAETGTDERSSVLEKLIVRWAGTAPIVLTGTDTYDSAGMSWAKFRALEAFCGEEWVVFSGHTAGTVVYSCAVGSGEGGGTVEPDGVDSETVLLLPPWTSGRLNTYHQIFEGYYGTLMLKTHLQNLCAKIVWTWDMDRQEYDTDVSGVVASIQQSLTNDPDQGKLLLSEFSRSIRATGMLSQADYLAFRETFIQQDLSLGWVIDTGGLSVIDQKGQGSRPSSPHMEGTFGSDAILGSLTEGDGWINGLTGDDVIYGTDRQEYLVHGSGDALLVAGGGNDIIWAGEDDDILDGGQGDDRLFGEAGNDTYILRTGSGQDIIHESFANVDDDGDTIWIGSFLTPDEVAVKRSGNDLVVQIIGTDDKMTVQNFFRTYTAEIVSIDQIQFADGTVWGLEEILRRQGLATEGNDYLVGTAGDDVIDALGGYDIVLGADGNDTLNERCRAKTPNGFMGSIFQHESLGVGLVGRSRLVFRLTGLPDKTPYGLVSGNMRYAA